MTSVLVLAALAASSTVPVSIEPGAAADAVVAGAEPEVRPLLEEVLHRNPRLDRLRSEAAAAAARAPQVASLPDPVAALTLFVLPPETRVGPQRAALSVSQALPWLSKLDLAEKRELLEAAAARWRLEAARLELVTEARVLVEELLFLDAEERLLREDTDTLEHYEELSQARYSSGVGQGQAVVKLQAEITRSRTRRLELERRRARLVSRLNTLRDRFDGEPVRLPGERERRRLPSGMDPLGGLGGLEELALAHRPEMAEARTAVEAAQAGVELAALEGRPGFRVGLSYTLVDRRRDAVGQANPPEGNGDDILALSGGLSLPIWRDRVEAAAEQAGARRLVTEAMLRERATEIRGTIADLRYRIPLILEQSELLDGALLIQATESLELAEAAYASGAGSALDLLDAERVLLSVRLGAERARTDLAIAMVQLEGTVGAPLWTDDTEGGAS